MKKTLVTILLVTCLLTQTVSALTLTAENKVEVESGTYILHEIYRSESYWTTKQYDKEIIETLQLEEKTTLYFKENRKEYNYMACMVGDKKDGSTNIYVWYNNYNKE